MITGSKGKQLYVGDVILVEDDDLLCSLMIEILSDIGAGCIAFGTADDALIHLLQTHGACSLVITDHGVPGQLLGGDLARMIKEKWPGIAVIITSGHELKLSEFPSQVRYLKKPWAIDALITTIDELVNNPPA